jgi:hypothetical protein
MSTGFVLRVPLLPVYPPMFKTGIKTGSLFLYHQLNQTWGLVIINNLEPETLNGKFPKLH